jgi:hypothetical protein
MSIGTFIIIVASLATVNYLAFAVMALRNEGGAPVEGLSERTIAAFTIAVSVPVAIALRSLDFGVDTLTYYRFYQQYCLLGDRDFEIGYLLSFAALNVATFGSCSADLLASTWVALIVLSFLMLPISWYYRICLLALSLVSIIGVELHTNAFRQGLSAAVLLSGVAWYERNKKVGIALLLVSTILHTSAALVLVALFLSRLRWRWYLLGVAVLAIVALNYQAFTFIPAVEQLVFEIAKYSAHEAADFWVRVLAAAQLFLVPAIAYLFSGKTATADGSAEEIAALRDGRAMAAKLALTALPYLSLPYFGYRYIYGIYFVTLLLVRRSIADYRSPAFETLLVSNIILLLAWAFGSTIISAAPFINL